MSGTIKVLNVAEKPSVAKSVSGLLSRNQGLRVRDGRSRYNKIFEFNYSIRGQPCHMLFTSVTGHLMELEFEDRFRKWHSCDPGDLYHAPVRKFVPEDKLDIKRTLEEEARRCQWLVLWLDCDREGENIAFEVIEVCRAVNRHLTIRRARFSALIEREIHHATQNLIDPNQWFSDAVDARQATELSHIEEIDLRIGASFTRFQTMLLRDKFVIDSATDDRNLVLSYGPCQFPTLGFVVERYWEVQSHEPEEFWTINCSHKSDEGVATFNWMRGHLFDYTCAVIVYEMCVQEPNATVTKVQHQEKLKYPPYPLSTIELEKRASRYFRMSSEHTMKAIVQEQQEHPEWGSYAQRLLDPETGLWRNPGSGGHDDKAHPPIHPTKFSVGEHGWSQDHRRNYLDVYRYESWGASMIPTYTVGQQFIPTSLTLDTGVTRPPPLLSEADLLSCMDKGEALVMGYDDMGYELWKPNLRSMMEFDMKQVSVGNKSKDEVLAACLQQMKACFLDARLNKVKLLEAMAVFFERSNRAVGGDNYAAGEVVRQCNLCQESSMVLKKNREGNFMVGCSGFPQCRNAIWLPGSILEAAVTSNICSSCNPGPVYLIQFKFRQIEIPPGFNANHLGCIGGCDDTLRQLIEICGTGSRMSARGRGPTTTSSNVPRNSNHGVCIHCQLTGHSSNDCPSQFSRSRNSRSRANSQNGEPSVSCSTCETPCVLRTANTENNRGRKFYSCPSQECNFFISAFHRIQRVVIALVLIKCIYGAPMANKIGSDIKLCSCRWEDDLNNGNGRSIPRSTANRSASNSSRRGGRGRFGRNGSRAADTTFVSATGDPVSNRCYVCGDPSHFANVCPNRGM
ncbi:hypothetical protein V6N11_015465 [Hibiscus sabdariffa]|uniref:DNA topoisomerase n=2 Tax=Hibiscus sabdariffa TaxID=183260 RepID=A0ABR2TSP3_9ROSI